jgi:Rrf2 family transcriptional regulator, iron-sulfur cluster assembly transcription factor
MIFSKSFGYAVRGIIYIASRQNEKHFVQVEEISSNLEAPRHFMGKILKRLAKEGVLSSVKGPSGGFTINATTLSLPLINLIYITNDIASLNSCVLRFKECNGTNPCPMHFQMETIRKELKQMLTGTLIGDLLNPANKELIENINTIVQLPNPSDGSGLTEDGHQKPFNQPQVLIPV